MMTWKLHYLEIAFITNISQEILQSTDATCEFMQSCSSQTTTLHTGQCGVQIWVGARNFSYEAEWCLH